MVVHSSTQNPTEIQARRGRDAGRRAARGRVHLQADGRGVRRQGIAGRDSRDDGRARRPQNGPAGPRHLQQRRRHARHRQAARVPQRVGSRLRRRRPHPGPACRVLLQRRLLDRPVAGRDGADAAAHRQLLLPAARRAHRPGVLHESAVEHGLPRLRRPAGDGRHRKHLESIAEHLGIDAFDVRMRNLYGVGERNVTPYGQMFDRNHLPEIFATLAAQSQYRKRREEIAAVQRTRRARTFAAWR